MAGRLSYTCKALTLMTLASYNVHLPVSQGLQLFLRPSVTAEHPLRRIQKRDLGLVKSANPCVTVSRKW